MKKPSTESLSVMLKRTVVCGSPTVVRACTELLLIEALSEAILSASHPTRLEKRIKESNMRASHWAVRNIKAQ